MQRCYTWIWDDLLTKFVNAMVEHKSVAEIRVLREALEEATREIERLHAALANCIEFFFDGWTPDWPKWNFSVVKSSNLSSST
jgi:hypothetical protein